MKKKTTPWKKAAPKKAGGTKRTKTSKAAAKGAAKRAGRPYPNLADNMNAARQQRESWKK